VLSALETWGDQTIINQFTAIFLGKEYACLIVMRVSVELASYCVGIAIDEGIKSFSPLIDIILWRNMTNDVSKLTFQLGLFQLVLKPFQHLSWISGISQQKEVKVVLCLSIQRNDFEIIEFRDFNREVPLSSEHIIGLLV